MATVPGTAAAAKIFVALVALQSPTPTVSPILGAANMERTTSQAQIATTSSLLQEFDENWSAIGSTYVGSVANQSVPELGASGRPTTAIENLVGEFRRWRLFGENWDGEGATAPLMGSLKEAELFVRLLSEEKALPEPMLHGSGHAGLFWNGEELYADLEFLGDSRIAYYIERQGDKHKGVLKFDSQKMPAVFTAVLQA